MNRKKTIDYTVTRRSRDSYSQLNTSKSRSDNRDQRGRGDGGQQKKPFWSRDDKNVVCYNSDLQKINFEEEGGEIGS